MSENSELSKKVHERIKVLRNELNRDLQAARSLEEGKDEAIFESGYLLYFFRSRYFIFSTCSETNG